MAELILDVLGLPFGYDKQGQYFDAGTDIGLQPGESVPAFYFHGFSERAASTVARIGKAVYTGIGTLAGASGHVFRVVLDGGQALARKIHADALAGRARVSSDSMAHLVRPYGIVGKAGRVTSWPISGMSLMDASTYEAAINPNAVAMAAAKARQAARVAGIVQVHRPMSRDALIAQAVAQAVKSAAPGLHRVADQLVDAEWSAFTDAVLAEARPHAWRRLQAEREWQAGLRQYRR